MEKSQRDYLLSRIRDIEQSFRMRNNDVEVKEPIEVVKARKLIEQYEGEQKKKLDGQIKVFRKLMIRARELVYIGDFGDALTHIKSVEDRFE